MSAFDPPKGNLPAIRAAAAQLGSVGTQLGTDERSTRAAAAEAERDWTGERYVAFKTAGAGVQYQLRTSARGCNEASDILARFCNVYDNTITQVAGYARQADAARTHANKKGADGKTDPDMQKRLPGKIEQFERDAEDAKKALARSAMDAASAIDALTSRVAPVSSKLSPSQIRQQVNNEFHMTGLKGDPNGKLTDDEALELLGAAEQAVPITAINADGSVDYAEADKTPTPPRRGSSPKEVHDWWISLSPMQQNAVLQKQCAKVGNLDGIPVVDRDFANRRHLGVVRQDVNTRLAALKNKEPSKWEYRSYGSTPYRVISNAWDKWNKECTALKGRADNIGRIDTTLSSTSPAPHYLVGWDEDGDTDGHAIIATGNPDIADNVSTYVPGMGTKVSGIKGGVSRTDLMYKSAALAGSPSTATIAWYGYDAPQDLTDADDDNRARIAAPKLRSFETGLRATHDGTFHNTVVAHSYGTTVTGYSASHGHSLDVDDIAFVASPGVSVDKASDLRLSGGKHGSSKNIYATTAEYDPIRLAEGINGGVPRLSDFGGREFKSDPDKGSNWTLGWNSAAHSAYWDRGNPSLRSMGMIIAGRGQETE